MEPRKSKRKLLYTMKQHTPKDVLGQGNHTPDSPSTKPSPAEHGDRKGSFWDRRQGEGPGNSEQRQAIRFVS